MSKLSVLQAQTLEIHRTLFEMETSIGGPVEAKTAELLSGLIEELDEIVAATEDLPQALPLYLRSAARSRLMSAIEDPREAAEAAESASDDCLAAIAIAREGLLRGDLETRQMLGDCVQRLATVLYWRPDRSLSHLKAVEEQLTDYLNLVASDGPAAIAAARLAAAMAGMVDEGAGSGDPSAARRTVRACQNWTDRAFEILEGLPPRSRAPAAPDVAGALGGSLMIAFEEESAPLEAHDFFELAPRRLRQFESLRDRFAAHGSAERWSRQEEVLTTAVMRAADRMMTALAEPLAPEAGYAVQVLIRSFIHRLPATSWDRTGTAREVLERKARFHEDEEATLQGYLDSLELTLLRSSFVTLRSSIADSRSDEETGPEAMEENVAVAIFALATTTPEASPAYIAGALHSSGHERPLPEREVEIAELLAEMRENAAANGLDPSLLPFYVSSTLMAWSTSPAEEVGALVDEIDRLVKRVCLPVARRDLTQGSRVASWLITRLTELETAWPRADEEALLRLLDETERKLGELGETGPVLALGRAQLALNRVHKAEGSYDEVSEAADALLRYVDDHPELPDDSTAYHHEALVRIIRLAAVAALGARDDAGTTEPPGGEVDDLVTRLLTISGDPEVDRDSRKAAARHVAEINALRMAMATSAADFSPSTWTEIVENQPFAYLLGMVRAGESGIDSKPDPTLVKRAIAAVLARRHGFSGVQPDGVRHLEALTRPAIRSQLKINGDDAIAVGRRVAKMLDETSPEAANLAFLTTLNLAGLALDSAVGSEYRQLFEEVAERFMVTALRSPGEAPLTAQFMTMASTLSLNFGAVRETEFSHRLRVALGAHLLAVKDGDLDLAARSAYTTAEIYRVRGQLSEASGWFEVYDYWRASGALSDPSHRRLTEGIELDRDQLRAALDAEIDSRDGAGA